jgi:hypothetical protein
MPKGKPQYCACGCGVTPTTYRKKFLETWATGYPYVDSGMYYCARYGQTDKNGYTCWSVVPVSDIDETYHIDHITAKNKGGANCIHNLRIMCAHCNTSKQDDHTKSSKACANKSSNSIAKYIGDNIANAPVRKSKNKSRKKTQASNNTIDNQNHDNFQSDFQFDFQLDCIDYDALRALGYIE